MDASRPESELMLLKTAMMLLRFLAAILSFGAIYIKPSQTIIESPRRIDH
jgi:hypothetical protein